MLAAATGRAVVVDNDANVAALARGHATAPPPAHAHALLVTLGTGIGGGLLLDGRLYRGANGFAAEIGHFTVERGGPMCACGELGHWEAIASGTRSAAWPASSSHRGRGASDPRGRGRRPRPR